MAWYDGISSYFSSGQGWGDLLSGVAAVAASSSDKKKDKTDYEQALGAIKATGDQQLRKSAFERELESYSKAEDTQRKRIGIDSYGQFSKLQARVPGYTPKPIAALPPKPDYTKY
jgi:hypothetical protein